MIAENYKDELKKIISDLMNGKTENAQKRVNELYSYKPVRLLWQVAQFWLTASGGDWIGGFNNISKYFMQGLSCDGAEEFIDLHKRYINVLGRQEELRHLNYAYGNDEARRLEEDLLEKALQEYYRQKTEYNLSVVMQKYLNVEERIVFLIIRMWLVNSGYIQDDNNEEWYYKEKNYDYLKELVLNSNTAFILIEDKKNRIMCNLLAEILYKFGHLVYILAEPIEIEGTNVHADEVLQICLDNVQCYEESVTLPVCEISFQDGHKEDNRAELLQYLYENELERNYGIVLASGKMLYRLMENNLLRKNMEFLSEFNYLTLSDKTQVAWLGNYLAYISDIYLFDVEKRLEEEPKVDFSIVIPARNSAGSLYYTLKTCLNQDFTGTYEIIVSDNSTDGNMEVCQVCQDLDSPHIRYVKTPRNLPLTKSFEFAFLQAKGEFIFSIGSDDGVCPWTLSILKEVLGKYPDEYILQWVRGFYGWNGWQSSSEDRLVIPGRYEPGDMRMHYVDRTEYFARILKDVSWIFSLPNLYLNSGFRRSYLQILLKETGRLWNGCNQDVYIGVMNAAINKQILNIEYPLVIAGMSDNSLGYQVNRPQNQQMSEEIKREIQKSLNVGDNIGGYVNNRVICKMPFGTGDTASMYANLLTAIQLGILPDEWEKVLLDDKKMFLQIISEYDLRDDYFDMYIHYARRLAQNKGADFQQWFDHMIYNKVMQPRLYTPSEEKGMEKKKGYKEGPTEGGGLAIDASRFGVTNIAEAMELFEQWIYWTPERWQQELEKRAGK